MAKVYWDRLREGEVLFERMGPPITPVQIAKFAGASEDYSPLHLDSEFADTLGYRGVFAQEIMVYGFANEILRVFAQNMRIVSISEIFHKLARPGDVLGVIAKVKTKELVNQEPRLVIDLWVENQHKNAVMKGVANCILWKNAAEEKGSRNKLPLISAITRRELSVGCKNTLTSCRPLNEVLESLKDRKTG